MYRFTKWEKIGLASIIVLIALMFGGGVAVSIIYTANTINQDNQNWCTSLEIITQHPVSPPPKGSHQAQTDDYKLYLSFKDLERKYQCPMK